MKKSKNPLVYLAVLLVIAGVVAAGLFGNSKNGPENIVKQFYQFEQEGDFGSSWELFHSQMKLRFNKDQYIQSRAHVFMQDMKVKTFTYELGDIKKLDNWKLTKGNAALKEVYKVPVYQTFQSQFGNFTIEQTSFVAKEKGKWKLLWDYIQK